MAKLVLFWGEKSDLSFSWRMVGGQEKDSSQLPSDHIDRYQIESHDLLKADLSCLAEMAEMSGTRGVTLVLSSTDITAAQVEVPNKAQRLLRKAVPYMLEDEVATSVDDLFFAFADKQKNKKLAVRAIERDYLENLIEEFQQAEIRLNEILTDIDLIAAPEEGIKLVVSPSHCLSIDSEESRWHCHPDDYSWLIQKQINAADEDEELPIAIPLEIYSEEPVDQFVHQLPVGRFASESHHVADIYEWMLEQKNTSVNLLQAEYEPKKENSKFKGFLLKVATVAGFMLITHLFYQGANIYTLSEKKEQLDKQKLTLYKQAFPGAKKVRNPEKSMKVYVNSLGSSSGEGDFLSLLSSSSQQLTDLSKIYPTNISYDGTRNELRLDVIASDLTVLDQYAESLKSNGHKVEKSPETQRGEGYSSRLTIVK